MSSVTLELEGLNELREALGRLPYVLAEKSRDRVTSAAQAAATRIRDGYPKRTGNLRNGVKVTIQYSGGTGVLAIVKNSAPHAWMFENGTQVRHTKIGADRGSMPAGHVFVPNAQQERRAMYQDLKAIVASEGLEVSGDA